jgi:hypothetical protein
MPEAPKPTQHIHRWRRSRRRRLGSAPRAATAHCADDLRDHIPNKKEEDKSLVKQFLILSQPVMANDRFSQHKQTDA